AAAAELSEQPTEPLQARGLRLRLLLEAAEDRRDERGGAARRLVLADAQFARHRLESADLGEEVGDLHVRDSLMNGCCRLSPAGPSVRCRRWRRCARARSCAATCSSLPNPPSDRPGSRVPWPAPCARRSCC